LQRAIELDPKYREMAQTDTDFDGIRESAAFQAVNHHIMTQSFPCPYLNGEVKLSDERAQHIAATHPGTLPDYLEQFAATLADPQQIRRSDRDATALLFSRWFDTIRTGRYFVVVAVQESEA